MGPMVTFVVFFIFFCPSEAYPRRTEEGTSSMWHVFRQIHESDVAKRPYLTARRSSSPMVIERTRIIPASEPKPLAPSTIITRIKAAGAAEETPTTKAPKSALSSVWSLKVSGRMSEADGLPFTHATTKHVGTSEHLTSSTSTANSDQAETKASGKSEAAQAEHLRQQSDRTAERNQSWAQGEREQSSHAERAFNEGGSGRRTQQNSSLKFWQVFRKRIPERWSVFNKAEPATNETLARTAEEDSRLEADDKALMDQIKALDDAVVATTTTQLPEPTVQRNDLHVGSSQQLGPSVNGPSRKQLTIQVDNATFYTANSFVNGSLVFERTDLTDDMKNSQSLEDIEVFYPGISTMIQSRPFRIVINWSGVVMAEAESEVAASETAETTELSAPPSVVESTTETSVTSVSEKNITSADMMSFHLPSTDEIVPTVSEKNITSADMMSFHLSSTDGSVPTVSEENATPADPTSFQSASSDTNVLGVSEDSITPAEFISFHLTSTDTDVPSPSDENATPVEFVSEEDAEALTTTMPTSTTDDQLTTPLLKISEGSALTDPLTSTTITLAEPSASARSFISVSSSSSSSSSSVSTSNGISYISHVSSSYSSSNPGSVSLNTRTSTSTASQGNTTIGSATGSIDLIAPDNTTSIVASSESLNSTTAVRSRVIQPARFWSIVSAKNPVELPKPRTAEISEILPLNFLKNHSLSTNREPTMAPLLIFMKGSSPIVFAASRESLDQFTTVRPKVEKQTPSTPTPVAHEKWKNQSLPFQPKANFSSSNATAKVSSQNSSLSSLILARTALVSSKPSPAFSNNSSSSDAKLKPSARQMEADDAGSRATPKVHVIMATALADPPEFEFRDRSLDSAEDNGGRKYDSYWAVPTHGQLVETPNGYLAGSSPGVSSHVTNQSHVSNTLPSAPRITCGQETSAEEFVLTNPSYPDPDEDAGRCDFRLRVTSASVCQVRFEFKDSRMLLPRHGSCLYQQMSVSGALAVMSGPKFCGWNVDQHFYLDLSDDGTSPRHVNINIHTKAAGYRYSYAIVVKQIDCRPQNQLMAPKGCFQYYHSSRTGEIKSFNFEGGEYWSEQNYKICIRTSPKTCTISMTSANGNFGLHELTNRTPKSIGRTCHRDYLVIPDIFRAGSLLTDDSDKPELTNDRVCGTKFADPRDIRARPGILAGPLKHDVYVMEFHAGTFRRYETRHSGQGFAINYKEMEDCPESVNRRSR